MLVHSVSPDISETEIVAFPSDNQPQRSSKPPPLERNTPAQNQSNQSTNAPKSHEHQSNLLTNYGLHMHPNRTDELFDRFDLVYRASYPVKLFITKEKYTPKYKSCFGKKYRMGKRSEVLDMPPFPIYIDDKIGQCSYEIFGGS